MCRLMYCALAALTLCAAAIHGEASAGGGAIQTQGVRFQSKGISLAPRVVPLSEVLPFQPPQTYSYYYARTTAYSRQ